MDFRKQGIDEHSQSQASESRSLAGARFLDNAACGD